MGECSGLCLTQCGGHEAEICGLDFGMMQRKQQFWDALRSETEIQSVVTTVDLASLQVSCTPRSVTLTWKLALLACLY